MAEERLPGRWWLQSWLYLFRRGFGQVTPLLLGSPLGRLEDMSPKGEQLGQVGVLSRV